MPITTTSPNASFLKNALLSRNAQVAKFVQYCEPRVLEKCSCDDLSSGAKLVLEAGPLVRQEFGKCTLVAPPQALANRTIGLLKWWVVVFMQFAYKLPDTAQAGVRQFKVPRDTAEICNNEES